MDPSGEPGQNKDSLLLERLELSLRASSEGLWDWSLDDGSIYYSPRVLELLEAGDETDAPNVFLPPHGAIHEDDLEMFGRVVARALEPHGPDTLAIDAKVRTVMAEPRWLRIRGTIVRDSHGRVARIAGSMIDISLRKRAEAQVEEERFLLRQLIDHIPVQVYFKDRESRFVLANQGMAEWMGLEHPDQLLGKHDRDFFLDQHSGEAQEDENRIMATDEPVTEKLEHETWQEGTDETWVLTSKFPWKDRNGKLKGTFGVSNDVTELVKTRQEAVVMAKELQQRNQAYEEELQLAREIQQALAGGGFPKIAAKDGSSLALGSRYIPISGLAGDFFEVIPISPGQAGMLICDVMGHGVRAALVVAMLRGLLEKQRGQAADPGLFLRGLNDGLSSILERAGTTMFATAFYAVADLEEGTLRYSCAGHPAPIAIGPDGIRQLADVRAEKGPALGLIRGAAYPTNELPLHSVDRLVMFTDGVLEAESRSGEPFFEKRLMEIVGKHAADPLDTLLDSILATVLEFSETMQFDDDVCLLAMEPHKAAVGV
ncbi:SpoIIE family protein phosphatase [Luteolibacter sp. SL250]|uniref:SpoIIE family protein phosphatase n=1 Tax=Luteolibacter sp. SL250 TaxID=2995170 RepID=UPI00226E6DE1|nr:SpoIIE family protein phosphatase [Luteolibacter sp. SL250]WAC21363.1 SpoIIE family protein phosphatase [Luteolibacter sp. SL250]